MSGAAPSKYSAAIDPQWLVACSSAIRDAAPISIRPMIVYSGDTVMCRKALADGPVGEYLRSIHLDAYSGVTVNGCSAHHISQDSRQ